MRTLKDKRLMPPTGYFFVDPDTGYRVEAGTLKTCIELARRHRESNRLEIPSDFEAQVEDFICLANDPSWSTGETDKAFRTPMTEYGIRAAIEAQGRAWMKDGTFVKEIDATRRAELCRGCENNVTSPICFSCVGLDKQQWGYFSKSTPVDPELRVCRATMVPNTMQVHIKDDVLIKTEKPMPDFCWHRKAVEARTSNED